METEVGKSYSPAMGLQSSETSKAARFGSLVEQLGLGPLKREPVKTLQINVGKLCNQACRHCHVDAGPKRTEMMDRATAETLAALMANSPSLETVDLTGGAPELNPQFRFLVTSARSLGLSVIDRCNLTVLFEPAMDWLPRFLSSQEVALVCSLPCYTADNVDKQRGSGVFERSIEALRLLNSLGYGLPGSRLSLDLVYNPVGPSLPPPQSQLQARYRDELREHFKVEFHRLLTITNMPVKRFAEQLDRAGAYEDYMELLVANFNPATIPALMCRTTLSVGWDGTLYDCDFNQMLEKPAGFTEASLASAAALASLAAVEGGAIATGRHCFGCTAGSGSSCGGELQPA